jgi:hypothetical protein
MHNRCTDFASLTPGAPLGPFTVRVSAAANARYWRAAGAGHPTLEAGALYPPIAANVTVLTFQQTCPEPVIQTRQRLACHRLAHADADLVATGSVTARYEKRGRAYVDVTVTVTTSDDDAPLWTSEVTFTPAATLPDPE